MSVLAPEAIDDDLTPVYLPEDIVDSLPTGPYNEHYQPVYEDHDFLVESVREVQQTGHVTTPENIRNTKKLLGQAAIDGFIVLEGSCAEPVQLNMPISTLVGEAETGEQVVRGSNLFKRIGAKVLHIRRDRGQSVKPRSSGTEMVSEEGQTREIPAGTVVSSYMGDGINGKGIDQRTAQPDRMVAMGVQARDLEDRMTETLGHHIPAAHEALLLAYEKAQVMVDKQGRRVLLSADVPWVGARTNNPEGEHVKLLSTVENAVGVKISDTSDATHIKALAERLNPNNEEGKLIFMMRVGGDKLEKLGQVLDAIRDHAPNAVIMYDIHGVTKTNEHKEKIRAVPDIINEILELTKACNSRGLRMSGVHLETMGDNSHNECVDELGERPTRPGNVDPRLNPRQLLRILNAITETVLNQELETNLN
jgi:3-deoxy-7-phosphoheptulonate synthase